MNDYRKADQTPPPPPSNGLDNDDIYTLTAEKLSRNQHKIERRRLKNKLSDRRSKTRLSLTGEPQADRREINRAANRETHRPSSQQN